MNAVKPFRMEAERAAELERIANEMWDGIEAEFRAATSELAQIAGDALYGPRIAELDRKIAERDDLTKQHADALGKALSSPPHSRRNGAVYGPSQGD